MDAANELTVFQRLVTCCHNLYFWKYDEELRLCSTTCPAAYLLPGFVLPYQRNILPEHLMQETMPSILTSVASLTWITQAEVQEGQIVSYHVIGPFFLDDYAAAAAEKLMYAAFPAMSRELLCAFIQSLPAMSLSHANEYAIMLHHCITGNAICLSDLNLYHMEYQQTKQNNQEIHHDHGYGVYQMELEILRMVREGNLDFHKITNQILLSECYMPKGTRETLRWAKNMNYASITLFARAAIEGGMEPKTALTLSDYYFQATEACSSQAELSLLGRTLQQDYVQRVHRIRTNRLSKIVQDCQNYIEVHLEDETLSHTLLAQQLNYSEGHLSRKFKEELGITVKGYIIRQRLVRAKELMRSTDLSIQDISHRLHFCSQSHFAAAFKKEYGMTPSQWRTMPE